MPRASRTATALGLAALAAPLLIALPARADILPSPGSSSTAQSASTSTTSSSTACATDLSGLLCSATSTSSSSSSKSTTRSSSTTTSRSSTTSSSTGATSQAPAAGSAGPGSAPPPASPSAGPMPTAQAVAAAVASFRNAPFLTQLLDILRHPTSGQRPDLRHFRPAADAAGDRGAAGGLLDGQGTPPAHGSLGLAVAIALLGMLAAMSVGLLSASAEARLALRRGLAAAWHWHPSLHRILIALHNLRARLHPLRRRASRLRARLGVPHMALRRHSHRSLAAASAVADLPALVVAAVLGAAATTPAALLPVGSAAGGARLGSPYLRGEVALSEDVQAVSSQAPAAWVRLVTIERGLAAQQDELAAQEGQIARLVINLGGHNPDNDDSVVVGHDSPAQQGDTLAELVAAHAATQAAYQRSLQAEYDLYRAAAQDPAQRSQLTQAAAAAPQAKAAVDYNLSLVQTQLSQEAAIAQAEGRLQQLGSLSAAQLRAMQQHQAFIAPVVAPVTQPFGPTDFALEPPLSFDGTFYPHFHTGLDLGAPLDTPVHAAADGVVLLAQASVDSTGKLVGYGNYVVIAHPDGFVTLYGHLDSVAVKAGQVVHQGEIVGLEGSTGWSTGPHVHFEIRHDGQFMDPAPYLAGQLPS